MDTPPHQFCKNLFEHVLFECKLTGEVQNSLHKNNCCKDIFLLIKSNNERYYGEGD